MKEKLGVFISLLSDYGFKRIFGEPDNRNLLISFLNALFEGEWVVDDVDYDNVEDPGLTDEQRGLRYDVYCHSVNDKNEPTMHFIIEMQNDYQPNFDRRALYYVAEAYTRQGEKGSGFDFVPVIGIFVMNFDWRGEAPNTQKVERKGFMDLDTHEPFTNLMRMYFIKLHSTPRREEDCKTEIDQWMYCIKNLGKMKDIAFKKENPIFEELAKKARVAALTPDERLEYVRSLKAYRDYHNIIRSNYIDGERAGEKRGIAIGEKRGIAMGEKMGVEMTARNMLQMGLPMDVISKATGLSSERLSSL